MLDIVNAAVSTNTINTRKPDGQGQSAQAQIRLEPQLRQPQARVPEVPLQTQQGVLGNNNATGVALLNNREQVALNAIRQQVQVLSLEGNFRPSRRSTATEAEDITAALQNSIAINTTQRATTPAAAQQLAAAALALANGGGQNAPQEVEQVEGLLTAPAAADSAPNPADVPILKDAILPDLNKFVGLRSSIPGAEQPATAATAIDVEA